MRIEPSILAILDKCTVDGHLVFLPVGQLDRKAYESVNKVLENIGGKWNRKAKGHVFEDDPAERLDMAILAGSVTDFKKEFQFFETPESISERMVKEAGIISHHRVLEPSAGKGRIAKAIARHIFQWPGTIIDTLIELNENHHRALRTLGIADRVLLGDFLGHRERYDRIVMNPPFTRQQDIDHITHAFALLNPDGVLVSISSESPFFRDTEKARNFRSLIDKYGESEKLPAGAFRESGADVQTRIVKLTRPTAGSEPLAGRRCAK